MGMESPVEVSWSILLSGVIGAIIASIAAIVGALIYGRVALRSIEKQVKAAVSLQATTQLDECVAALRAVAVELIHNKAHLSDAYRGTRAKALSGRVWQTLLPKLGPIEIETLKTISLAYFVVENIKAGQDSVESELANRRPAESHRFVAAAWTEAGPKVEAAIQAIASEIQSLEKTRATLPFSETKGTPEVHKNGCGN